MALSVDVVIPVFNQWELTESCLRHLAAQTREHQAIVGDNGSTDATSERLTRDWPAVRVLRTDGPEAFAVVCNAGAAAGSGDVIVLLNNDVDCRPDFLEQVVAPLEREPALGSVAALCTRPGGRQIDSVGITCDTTLSPFARLQGRPVAAAGSAAPVLAGPAGTAGAYRRTAWEQAGGLDEAFVAYHEDFDLALRLQALGWGTVAAPTAVCTHVGSASHGYRSYVQRRRGAFGRGYVLRRYGLLRGRAAPRTALTETIATVGDTLSSRDLAAGRGRLAGWRAARGMPTRAQPPQAIDSSITLRDAIALRRRGPEGQLAVMSPVSCSICETPLAEPTITAPDRLHGTPGRFAVAVCGSCGAGITLPPVSAPQLAAYYPEDYAPYQGRPHRVLGALSTGIRTWQGRRARQTAPVDAVVALHPGRAVDVGCGRGDIASMLAVRGWRMTGVEPSGAACAVARERGVEALQGVLAGVELERGAYDAALFRQSLEHTDDPVGDLRRIHAALRPDGVVAISVPNFGGWQSRRFRGHSFHLDLPRHRVHFTAAALERALLRAGFEDVRTSTSTSGVGLWASVQYRIFGRCLFPSGMRLHLATALCMLGLPVAVAADRLGGGDLLHAVARRPG